MKRNVIKQSSLDASKPFTHPADKINLLVTVYFSNLKNVTNIIEM